MSYYNYYCYVNVAVSLPTILGITIQFIVAFMILEMMVASFFHLLQMGMLCISTDKDSKQPRNVPQDFQMKLLEKVISGCDSTVDGFVVLIDTTTNWKHNMWDLSQWASSVDELEYQSND
jgi:hypothetical protein